MLFPVGTVMESWILAKLFPENFLSVVISFSPACHPSVAWWSGPSGTAHRASLSRSHSGDGPPLGTGLPFKAREL